MSTENKNPSAQTQKQIQDGVCFVYDWLTQRLKSGKMSKLDYDSCVEKLKKMKVFLTSNSDDRLISALENKELTLEKSAAEYYSIEDIKENSLEQPRDHVYGFNTRIVSEPAIFIDADKINKDFSKGLVPDITSVVAHEVTHAMGLSFSEKMVDMSLREKYYGTNFSQEDSEIKEEPIQVEIIPDNGQRYKHSSKKAQKENVSAKPKGVVLNEGIKYNSYADSSREIYARIMQMRHDMKLDPKKNYTPEEVEELRKQILQKKIKPHKKGDSWEIDFYIFDRYSNEQISHFLNDTAYIERAENDTSTYFASLKNKMKSDFAKYNQFLASLEKEKRSFEKTADKKDKSSSRLKNTNSSVVLHYQRDYT